MSSDKKELIEIIKIELSETKSELRLVENKLDYCQNRLLDIRNEKEVLFKKISEYDIMDIDAQLKETQLIKDDFLKQKHRLDVTKEFLDESRKEVALLKKIIEDFKNMGNIDFIRNKYPDSFKKYVLSYNEYDTHEKFKFRLNDNE